MHREAIFETPRFLMQKLQPFIYTYIYISTHARHMLHLVTSSAMYGKHLIPVNFVYLTTLGVTANPLLANDCDAFIEYQICYQLIPNGQRLSGSLLEIAARAHICT